MKKILCIGNSFSCDATRYLYQMAHSAGEELRIANLYIGGCPLVRHAFNAQARSRDYELYFNGFATGFMVSSHEALLSNEWDFITLQQASGKSFDWDSYQPYLTIMQDYLRLFGKKAEIVVHQTWGYENGFERLERFGFADHDEMFEKVRVCYDKMADFLGARIIPSGRAVQLACDANVTRMHRDGYHLSKGAGRYVAAAVWMETLLGIPAENSTFRDFDEEIPEELLPVLNGFVHQAVAEYRKAEE